MNARDAEKLLGGYATGTLSEAERRELFAAALEDQALFDALADEEALRELLADPAARSRLLEVLAKPAPAPVVRPFWRRPAAMGLAASLLAAVGAGLLMKRTDLPRAYRPQLEPEAKPSSPPAPAQSQALDQATKAPASPKPPPPPPPAAVAEALGARSREEAPKVEPAKPTEALGKVEPGPARLQRQEQPSSEVAGGVAAGVAADTIQAGPPAAAPPPAQPPTAARAKQADKKAEEKRETRGYTGAGAPAAGADAVHGQNLFRSGDLASREPILPPPTWTLDPATPGHFKVRVASDPQGHPYLLRRGASGATVIAPVSRRTLTDGRLETAFSGPLGEGETLDLYLLAQPAPNPEALPAEGPLAGFRARVWPAPEKRP